MPWKFRRLPEDQPADAPPIVGPGESVFVELFTDGKLGVLPSIEEINAAAAEWVETVALPELRAEWDEHEAEQRNRR
jgi:hypothetical protein